MMSLFIALAMASCGDKNEAGDDNGTLPAAIKVTFEKRANCPESYVTLCAVLDNEIYYLSTSSLLKYTPSSDKWETLVGALRDSYSIFAFEGEIFCHYGNFQLAMYDKSNNSWVDAAEKLGRHDNISIRQCVTLCGKLFVRNHSYQCYVFNPDTRSFEQINGTAPTNTENICEIGDNAYTIGGSTISQFNTNSFASSNKLNLDHAYDLVCNYDASRMLCVYANALPYSLGVGIYNPATNDCAEYRIDNADRQIPTVGDHIVNAGGRIFIGPTNAAFYELKIR